MTILPGSLDYLYYNGILDHIPYEAYEMTPLVGRMNNVQTQQPYQMQNNMAQIGMQNSSAQNVFSSQYGNVYGNYGTSTSDYLNLARQGNLYNYNSPDAFVNTYSQQLTGIKQPQSNKSNSIKDTINSATQNITSKFSGMSNTGKGFIGLGAIILSAVMIFKGGKGKRVKANNNIKKSFWSKFNPKNWGKKTEPPKPVEPKRSFWQKLGFGKKK